MSVTTLHRYACDGSCGGVEIIEATLDGKSNPPAGWRYIDGLTWCGTDRCTEQLLANVRAGMAEELARFEVAARGDR